MWFKAGFNVKHVELLLSIFERERERECTPVLYGRVTLKQVKLELRKLPRSAYPVRTHSRDLACAWVAAHAFNQHLTPIRPPSYRRQECTLCIYPKDIWRPGEQTIMLNFPSPSRSLRVVIWSPSTRWSIIVAPDTLGRDEENERVFYVEKNTRFAAGEGGRVGYCKWVESKYVAVDDGFRKWE